VLMAKKASCQGEATSRDTLRWIDEMDTTFIDALIEECRKENRVDGTFTTMAYDNILSLLRSIYGNHLRKENLKNRLKTLKDHFEVCYDHFHGLSEFSWNLITKMFEAEAEVWKELIKEMGELPFIFYKRFRDELSINLSFYDFSGNELQVIIEKGHRTAIIVASYNNFYMLYGLKQGGWLNICYAGKDKFLILEVEDHNMHFKEPCFSPIKLSGDIKPSISVKDVIDLSESTNVLNPVLHSVNFSDINVSLNESNQSSFHNLSPLESPFSVHVVHDFLHKELPVYSDCIADHIQDSVTDNHIPCEVVIGPANVSDPFKQVLSLEEVPSSSICPNPLNVSFSSCYHVSNDQPSLSIYSHLLPDIQQPISTPVVFSLP
ncbi:hypothetical protein HN51_011722, partial [Arachis hypogaea]